MTSARPPLLAPLLVVLGGCSASILPASPDGALAGDVVTLADGAVVLVLPDGAVVALPDGAVAAPLDGSTTGLDASLAEASSADASLSDAVARGEGGFVRDGAGPAGLFGSCSRSADCAGSGAVCDPRYPGGLCTRSCMRDADCGDGSSALCAGGQCRPRCALGGGECALSEACVRVSPDDLTAGVCFPSCFVTGGPAGAPPCAAGLVCDPYAMGGPSCVPTPHAGGRDGEPCTSDRDCAGFCLTELQPDGAPTGWLGGSCASLGRLPDRSAYAPGRPLPQSNCPDGTVALPPNPIISAGDMAVCLVVCTADSDCRAGRRCNRELYGLGTPPTNGFCAPLDCMSALYRSRPNSGCPVGASCRGSSMMAGMGVCAR